MQLVRVEFHCHTIYSKDSLSKPSDLVRRSRERGIDRLIITDHNSIQGALEAKELDPKRIIVGEEIMTTKGELLAAFVTEQIPKGLPPIEVISRLRDQGAFISVSHPFDKHRNGAWKESDLISILPFVDAIEVFNARCVNPDFNGQAKKFSQARQVLGTVGSDAHTLREVGRATMLVPEFANGNELKENLNFAEVDVRLSSPFIHLASRWAVMAKKIGLIKSI